MVTALPRFVLAAAASGQGKTTVSVGIMAALTRRGTRVAPAKVGPDFIDPGYHTLATGRAGRNLDPWLQGEELLVPLLLHGARHPMPADVTVIEGAMGLFDGRLGTEGYASTAHVAALTRSPVVVVLDVSGASRSVAAVAHGLRTFDPNVDVVGVILNKAGSERHATEVRRACERRGLPVLGSLPRDGGLSVPSRHLGLVPAPERDGARDQLDQLAEQTAAYVDLDALLEVAAAAAPLDGQPWVPPQRATTADRPVVAVAGGRAFTFRYAETEEILRAQGLEPVIFDPIRDRQLPAGTRGLYLGGGFPEVHAPALSANRSLLKQLRDAVASGVPTVAECAGMLYLLEAVDGHAFASALPATAAMAPRLVLGYREATVATTTLLAEPGDTVRGHEFHRTRTTPSAGPAPAWHLDGRPDGFSLDPAGTGRPTVHASYLHTHWAGHPRLAERFADAVHGARTVAPSVSAGPPVPATPSIIAPPIPVAPGPQHHGDAEIADGLADFAVNVRAPRPPHWLQDTLAAALREIGAYPDALAARAVVAEHHGVDAEQVLLTNGAAEAFTLLAHGLRPNHPLIVHPQFSEPDAAFDRAGLTVEALVLDGDFALPPEAHAAVRRADLVVVGNPTNPTGVLHHADTVRALRPPGGVLVVDEAFIDIVPAERESLLGGDLTNTLVVRSLTKTWALAGIRAGFVIGDPRLIARLADQQPHWSVNALALAAMTAVSTPAAQREVAGWADEIAIWRTHLITGLRTLGLDPVPSQAPFVLVHTGPGVHARLRQAGFAVRRCDTFPGLDESWIRIAVRDPLATDALLRALAECLPMEEQPS